MQAFRVIVCTIFVLGILILGLYGFGVGVRV